MKLEKYTTKQELLYSNHVNDEYTTNLVPHSFSVNISLHKKSQIKAIRSNQFEVCYCHKNANQITLENEYPRLSNSNCWLQREIK